MTLLSKFIIISWLYPVINAKIRDVLEYDFKELQIHSCYSHNGGLQTPPGDPKFPF